MTELTTRVGTSPRRANLLQRGLDRFAPIARLSGLLVVMFSGCMLVPLVLAIWLAPQDAHGFAMAMAACVLLGVSLLGIGALRPFILQGREIFLFTTLIWLLISLLGAMPLHWSSLQLSWADAWFESVSGVTTTGATVIVGLQDLSAAILLWRGILQWLGGVGFIVMGMAILPFLRVGGMRLFQAESSDKSEKVLPRSTEVAKAIGKVYLVITVLCLLSYWLAGMPILDAVVHAMATVSTGGFANYDASMGVYRDQSWIYWISILFMIAAALPFVAYVKSWQGHKVQIWQDSQVRTFIYLLLLATVMLAAYLHFKNDIAWWSALTHSAFNVVSITTTTGFSSGDYNAWGSEAVIIFFYLTFMGGCSGSTSGGIKIFRIQLSLNLIGNQLRTLVHPRGVFTQRYNGRVVSVDIVRSMVAFTMLYFVSIACLALLLAWLGLDPITSLSGAATAVGNVGPGLGEIIGPAGTYTSVPDAAKYLLTIGMLLGRLEIVTVFILLSPAYWQR